MTSGKMHRQFKMYLTQEVWDWLFGSLVVSIDFSFCETLGKIDYMKYHIHLNNKESE